MQNEKEKNLKETFRQFLISKIRSKISIFVPKILFLSQNVALLGFSGFADPRSQMRSSFHEGHLVGTQLEAAPDNVSGKMRTATFRCIWLNKKMKFLKENRSQNAKSIQNLRILLQICFYRNVFASGLGGRGGRFMAAGHNTFSNGKSSKLKKNFTKKNFGN